LSQTTQYLNALLDDFLDTAGAERFIKVLAISDAAP